MKIRTRKEVIDGFYKALDGMEYMGFSCTPIPSFIDPNDEQDGDYSVMVYFEKKHEEDEDKLFCAMFRTTFHIVNLMEADDGRFARNMEFFRKKAEEFQACDRKPDAVIRAEDSPEHPNNRSTH